WHSAQDRAAEPLTRRARLPARQGLEGGRDPGLEHGGGQLLGQATQVCHSPARSIAGTTMAAFARPTWATAARIAPRSGSGNAWSMRPMARRLYAVRQDASPSTSRKYASSLS